MKDAFQIKKLVNVLTVIILILLLISLSIYLIFVSAFKKDVHIFMGDIPIRLKLSGLKVNKAVKEMEDCVNKINNDVSTNISSSYISKFNNFKSTQKFKVTPEIIEMLLISKEMYDASGNLFNIASYPLIKAWHFTADDLNDITIETDSDGARIMTKPSDSVINLILSSGVMDLNNLNIDKNNLEISKSNVDMMIDLGGIAKGYICDKLYAIAKKYNVKGYIDIAGNLYIISDIKIKVVNPRFVQQNKEKINGDISYYCSFYANHTSVVTSGDYERFYFDKSTGERCFHILNPISGKNEKNNIVSVSVICDSSTIADCLSTSIMLMGLNDNSKKLLQKYKAVAIVAYSVDDLKLHYTIYDENNFLHNFRINDSLIKSGYINEKK